MSETRYRDINSCRPISATARGKDDFHVVPKYALVMNEPSQTKSGRPAALVASIATARRLGRPKV
jgi:hypothetical protein